MRARTWAWLASGLLAFACSLNPQPDLPDSALGSGGGIPTTGGSTSNTGGTSAAGSINLGQGGTDVTLPAQGGQNAEASDAGGAGGAAGGEAGSGGDSAGGVGGAP